MGRATWRSCERSPWRRSSGSSRPPVAVRCPPRRRPRSTAAVAAVRRARGDPARHAGPGPGRHDVGRPAAHPLVRRPGHRRATRAHRRRAGRRRRVQRRTRPRLARLRGRQLGLVLSLEIYRNAVAYDTLATQIATGNAPDIIGPIGIRALQSFGDQLLDLSSYITSSGRRPVRDPPGPDRRLQGRRQADRHPDGRLPLVHLLQQEALQGGRPARAAAQGGRAVRRQGLGLGDRRRAGQEADRRRGRQRRHQRRLRSREHRPVRPRRPVDRERRPRVVDGLRRLGLRGRRRRQDRPVARQLAHGSQVLLRRRLERTTSSRTRPRSTAWPAATRSSPAGSRWTSSTCGTRAASTRPRAPRRDRLGHRGPPGRPGRQDDLQAPRRHDRHHGHARSTRTWRSRRSSSSPRPRSSPRCGARCRPCQRQQDAFFASLDERFAPLKIDWQVAQRHAANPDVPSHEAFMPNFQRADAANKALGSKLWTTPGLDVEDRDRRARHRPAGDLRRRRRLTLLLPTRGAPPAPRVALPRSIRPSHRR